MSRRTAGLPPRDPAKAVEAAVAGAEREERLFSLRKAAVLLGRNRETLSRWAEKEGMPVDRSGDTIRVDLAEVVKWIEERATQKEREKWAKSTPSMEALADRPMDPGDMLKLEQVKLTRIKIGREAEILIPRVAAEGAYQRALGLVRQSVMSVPERIVRDMGGYPVDQVREWRLKAIEQCRSALQEAEKAIRSVMPDFEIGP